MLYLLFEMHKCHMIPEVNGLTKTENPVLQIWRSHYGLQLKANGNPADKMHPQWCLYQAIVVESEDKRWAQTISPTKLHDEFLQFMVHEVSFMAVQLA